MKSNSIFQKKKKLEEWNYFIFLQTSFMSCLIQDNRITYFCAPAAVMCCFWLKRTESLSSHRYTVGKGRSILITSSENCGNFSLILHQNSTCGRYLEVNCNVESELFIF